MVTSKISDILTKCSEAILIEKTIQSKIRESIFDPELPSSGTPHLFLAEKQLLSLATYPRCTVGIFYVMPLIFEVNGKNHLYLRYLIYN